MTVSNHDKGDDLTPSAVVNPLVNESNVNHAGEFAQQQTLTDIASKLSKNRRPQSSTPSHVKDNKAITIPRSTSPTNSIPNRSNDISGMTMGDLASKFGKTRRNRNRNSPRNLDQPQDQHFANPHSDSTRNGNHNDGPAIAPTTLSSDSLVEVNDVPTSNSEYFTNARSSRTQFDGPGAILVDDDFMQRVLAKAELTPQEQNGPPSYHMHRSSSASAAKLASDILTTSVRRKSEEAGELKEVGELKRSKYLKVGLAVILVVAAVAIGVTIVLTSGGDSEDEEIDFDARRQDFFPVLSTISDITLLEQDGSPQNRALEWLVTEDKLSSMNDEEQLAQRYSLAVLYYSTGGEGWKAQKDWMMGSVDECDWQHITCNDSKVVSILMQVEFGNNLVGSLPSEIEIFSSLGALGLKENNLDGNIPTSIYLLTHLTRLDFAYNSLSGKIDSSISSLSKLAYLDLMANNLDKEKIPSNLFQLSNLATLDLNGNSFSGSIDSSISNLSKLEYLNLGMNSLTGNIEAVLFHLSNSTGSLTSLFLDHAMFSGSIPTLLGGFSNLEYLALNNNKITGSIPSQIGFLNLVELSLNNNKMTGGIPSEIGLLKMTYLELSYNSFNSTIPSELNSMDTLSHFIFTSTHITGFIPEALCEKRENVQDFLMNCADTTENCDECCNCCNDCF